MSRLVIEYTALHANGTVKEGTFRTRSTNPNRIAWRIKSLCRGYSRASYRTRKPRPVRQRQA